MIGAAQTGAEAFNLVPHWNNCVRTIFHISSVYNYRGAVRQQMGVDQGTKSFPEILEVINRFRSR